MRKNKNKYAFYFLQIFGSLLQNKSKNFVQFNGCINIDLFQRT